MAYRQVYFRIRTDCYSSGWTSDADRAAFKEESRRLFQELGWTATLGYNGGCDTVTMGQQDVELFPGKVSTIVLENHKRPNLYVYKIDADSGEPNRAHHFHRPRGGWAQRGRDRDGQHGPRRAEEPPAWGI